MRIDILTACPELLESPLNHSIVQRAKDKGLVEIYVHNLRDFTLDKHRKIDDYAFGFGAGMGLPNMKKYADEFSIESEVGKGTHIKMVVNL